MRGGAAVRWLKPSLLDCLLLSLLSWQFAVGGRWIGLLADADTGWHIRTGEWILEQKSWPRQDLFSFSKPCAPWYAWEWLAEILLALWHRLAGLSAVVVGSALVIVAAAVLTFLRMGRRQANVFLSMIALMLALGAASIHFLARPHLFTLLLWTVALTLLDNEQANPRALWWLVPLGLLWANTHGGFVALLASLALLAVGRAIEAGWEGGPRAALKVLPRYLALLGATLAATLANPYGWRLHLHIASYLRSSWIRNVVEEFQSPKFRSEHSLHFELLLFGALMLTPALVRGRRVAEALLVLFWAHASLVSARHIPLFAFLVAPLLAAEASSLLRELARRLGPKSALAILDEISRQSASGFRRLSLWAAAGVAGLLLLTPPAHWPRDFPAEKFPVGLVKRWAHKLAGSRVLTSDQWADYLIYRFYPHQRVYFDGRSDFYGPAIGEQYLKLLQGKPGWRQGLAELKFDYVLAPREWPLASLLAEQRGWRLLEQDRLAALYQPERRPDFP